jgi:hypothetical protein
MKYMSIFLAGVFALGLLPTTPALAQAATDVKCDGCVNTGDIATNGVRRADIQNFAINTPKLNNFAVSTAKIKPGAVTADKIAADAVGISQIDPTQVQQRVSGVCPRGHHATGISQIGTLICEAGPNTANSGPATATVVVDCDLGDSIADALAVPAIELTVEISGICEEDVFIARSDVTLKGTDPVTDGIRPSPGGLVRQVLTLVGVNFITIENLSLAGATTGIGINGSYGIDINNCIIEDNSVAGVIAGTGSGPVNLFNTAISSNGVPGDLGVWAANASHVNCTGCTIDNQNTAILLTEGSVMSIDDSTITGKNQAAAVLGGSRMISNSDKTGLSSFEGITDTAILLLGNSSLRLNNNESVTGRVLVLESSIAILDGTTQLNPSFFLNVVTGDSSLVSRNSSALVGNIFISEFSKVTLPSGSAVAGTLQCVSGADAFCADPGTATTSSDCNLCLNP